MPGREDFGILRSRARLDARVHRAADLYVTARIARRETALAAVLGDIACLGCDLARETDDGVIPGSSLFFFATSTGRAGRAAEASLSALREADLLVTENGRDRLRGFGDAYGSLIEDRRDARKRRRIAREKSRAEALAKSGEPEKFPDGSGNHRGTVADCSGVTGPVRSVPDPSGTLRSGEARPTAPPSADGPASPASTAAIGGGHDNGSTRKGRRQSAVSGFCADVERVLLEKHGTHLTDRAGCRIGTWRREIGALDGKATALEVADAVAADRGALLKPWEALDPLRKRLAGVTVHGRRAVPKPVAYSPSLEAALRRTEGRT